MAERSPDIAHLLTQFDDIILPDPIGWWPPSISLLTLLLLSFTVIIGVIWSLWSRHQKNQYRREANQLFEQAMAEANTPKAKIAAANKLLKQVAITHYGRHQIVALQAQAWANFLKETAQYIPQPDCLSTYLSAHYQPDFQYDEAKLATVLDYVKRWIQGHHK